MRAALIVWTRIALLPGLLTAQDLSLQPEVDPRPRVEVRLEASDRLPATPDRGGPRASASPDAPVSLLRFNTAAASARIVSRQAFYPVYMGMSERDDHERELLALRILLEEPGFCLASSRLLGMRREAPRPDSAGADQPMTTLRDWIAQAAADPGFRDRYLAYAGEGGRIDPDFLLYTTPHPAIASLYGEVVFEIRETTPRGVDLNSLNREVYDYYRRLPFAARLSPRGLIIRALLDRDEYVIPSHVPASDIVAAEIHARLPFRVGAGMVRMSGRLQRRYQRGSDGLGSWVDLVDRSGRPIRRFTTQAAVAPPAAPRSAATLPPALAARLAGLHVGGLPVLLR